MQINRRRIGCDRDRRPAGHAQRAAVCARRQGQPQGRWPVPGNASVLDGDGRSLRRNPPTIRRPDRHPVLSECAIGLGRRDADAGTFRRARHDDCFRHFDAGGRTGRRYQRHGVRVRRLRSCLAGDGRRSRRHHPRRPRQGRALCLSEKSSTAGLPQHHHQHACDRNRRRPQGHEDAGAAKPRSGCRCSPRLVHRLRPSPSTNCIRRCKPKIVDGQEEIRSR